MLKNGRARAALLCGNHLGCSCCNTTQTRRAGKKSVKARETRIWRDEHGLRR